MIQATRTKRWERLAACFVAVYLACPSGLSGNKGEVARYITSRVDDVLWRYLMTSWNLRPQAHRGQDASGEHAMAMADLGPGMLIEAEGQWLDRHRFFAEKVTVNLRDSEKQVHGTAYLQEEPSEASKIPGGDTATLKTDGYWLDLGAQTHREWDAVKIAMRAQQQASSDPGIGKLAALSSEIQRPAAERRANCRRSSRTRRSRSTGCLQDAARSAGGQRKGCTNRNRSNRIPARQQGARRMKLFQCGAFRSTFRNSAIPFCHRGIEARKSPGIPVFLLWKTPASMRLRCRTGRCLVNTGFARRHTERIAARVRAQPRDRACVAGALLARSARNARTASWADNCGTGCRRVHRRLGTFMAGLGIASVVERPPAGTGKPGGPAGTAECDRARLRSARGAQVLQNGHRPLRGSQHEQTLVRPRFELMRGSFMTVQLSRQYPEGHF